MSVGSKALVEQVLVGTMELLDREGFWIQGDLYEYKYIDSDDYAGFIVGACLLGCMQSACGALGVSKITNKRAIEVVEDLIEMTIPSFNDDVGTTLEDVKLLVKKAIANVRE